MYQLDDVELWDMFLMSADLGAKGSVSYLLQQDGTSHFLLETSGAFLLES